MIPYARDVALARAKLMRLRPTQFSVGLAEVEVKASEWKRMKKKDRDHAIQSHVFPAVLGLNHDFYITDHHHLGVALLEEGVKEVWVTKLDDMSWLDPLTFWRTLEFRGWAHLYDHRGRRRPYTDIPGKLTQLRDDPYRSLAGLVRTGGGYAKDETPFSEFLWADFFRARIPVSQIKSKQDQAVRAAIKLAHSREARYLPGWICPKRGGQ